MVSRLHISNNTMTKFVEFIDDEQGMIQAENLRKHNTNYRYQRINHILQAYPFDILPEIEYAYT